MSRIFCGFEGKFRILAQSGAGCYIIHERGCGDGQKGDLDLSYGGRECGADWSQDGLCRGICAASYLSKIEQGRVTASEDILRLLYERLSLPWYGGESALPALSERIDALYEQVYSGEFEALSEELSALAPQRDALLLSPAAADISVLRRSQHGAARARILTRQWSSILRRAVLRCCG